MASLKQIFKQNTHNTLFGGIAGFGRAVNRLYENRNHDIQSNGEAWLITRLGMVNPKVVFDVGANTGKYCKMVKSAIPGTSVWCFEPVAETFELLRKAVAEFTNVHLVQSGLFTEAKKLVIHKYPSHTHASLFELKAVPYASTGVEEIDLIQGDTFINSQGIDFIDMLKLDIEGAEMGALLGFTNAFQHKKIRLVQFEYGYINITTKNLLIDYYEFFRNHGYLVGKLYPRKVEFRPYKFKHEDFIGPNMIAIREDDHELRKLLA